MSGKLHTMKFKICYGCGKGFFILSNGTISCEYASKASALTEVDALVQEGLMDEFDASPIRVQISLSKLPANFTDDELLNMGQERPNSRITDDFLASFERF